MLTWPRLRKWLTRFFFFSSLPFVIIYLAAIIVFTFFKEDVKSYLVEKLNDELVTEVKIEDIEFSVLKKFPYASIELKNVSADEVTKAPVKEKLFTAGRIYCLFNWYEMFSSNFHLRKLDMEDLTLNLKRFDDGTDNFHFWKEQNSTGESGDFTLNIHKVGFKNVDFKYSDKKNKTFIAANLRTGMVSGSFADEQYTLTAKAALTADLLTFGGITVPPTPDVRISFIADANNKTKTYNFQNAQLFLGKLSLLSNGQIIAGKDPSLNLNIKGDKLDVAAVLSALPREYASFADDYASKGLFYLDGNVAGPLGKPIATAKFGISGGNITHKPTSTVMSNVNLSGTFNSGAVLEKGELVVNRVSLQLKQGSLRGKFKLVNLVNPYISASLQGTADLADIKNFIPGKEIKHMAGNLTVDAEIMGPLGEVEALADGNTNAVARGHVTVRNGSMEFSSFAHRISKVNATASFGNDIVDLNQCAFNIGKSNFTLNGRVLSFPSCILNNKQKIHVDASLGSSYCDIGELIKKPIENPLKDTASVFVLSERLESDLTIKADKVTFNKFGALNLSGNLKLYNRVIDLSAVSLQTAGGSVNLTANIDARGTSRIRTACEAKLSNIDIHSLFYEFDDFGQTTMQSKHLKGRLTATVAFAANWTKKLDIILPSIEAESDVELVNGELVDFEPVTAMSRFIQVDELKHIYFSNLSNHIIIRDSKIIIPSTEIQSSALNLTAYGTHDFDNNIDYHVKVSLRELLSKKFLKNKPKQVDADGEVVQDDGRGGSNLFLLVTGTAENPKVRYDVGAVKNKLKSDFMNEKFVLKVILKKEFGSKDGQEKGAEDNTNPLKEDKTPLFGKNKKKKEKKGATQDNQPVIEWNDN
jgi:hypothetical protein